MRLLILKLFLLTWTTSSIGQGINSTSGDRDKEKRIEVFTKWIRKNHIVFGQLPKADPRELTYDCDSVPMIKQTKGDTITYWIRTSWSTTGGLFLKNDIKQQSE